MLAISGVAWGLIGLASAVIVGTGWLYALMIRGSLTIDLGVGRSVHPLGPLAITIAAPRELVFEQISAPYLGRIPRGLRDKLEVLERSERMVVAAHRTKVRGFVIVTVESVMFEPPERVGFRLLRGPVPHVVESFLLREVEGGTELAYEGELGADLWFLGRLYGGQVAKVWVRTVAASMEQIKAAAEQRAAARSRRD